MCRASLEEGIDTIVVTPHVLRGRWRSLTVAELTAQLDELRKRVGSSPRLLLGSEYFFAHDVNEVLAAGTAIAPLAGSRYVLIELAANAVPPLFEQPLYRMQLDGWVPVLAHPERNRVYQSRPDLLASLIELGTKTQITAGSLLGEFGSEAKHAAELFLRRNLVHFLATDAHNMTKRPPRIRKATEALQALCGNEAAEALTVRNPRSVIENRTLEYEPEPITEKNSGLLTRLRSFFRH